MIEVWLFYNLFTYIKLNCFTIADVELPSFGLTCPRNIKQYADKTKNFTSITWPPVVATDNSGIKPLVIITGKRSIYYEGRHEIVYNATDRAGNYKICKFYVNVEGKLYAFILLIGAMSKVYQFSKQFTQNKAIRFSF